MEIIDINVGCIPRMSGGDARLVQIKTLSRRLPNEAVERGDAYVERGERFRYTCTYTIQGSDALFTVMT
jgi:hypothetical protein